MAEGRKRRRDEEGPRTTDDGPPRKSKQADHEPRRKLMVDSLPFTVFGSPLYSGAASCIRHLVSSIQDPLSPEQQPYAERSKKLKPSMHSFKELSNLFSERFKENILPKQPGKLYEAGNYFMQLGGKRIRPVMCLMGNELFDEISPDTWEAAFAIELFHNFTLIHDDIMDKASLRRGQATVHEKYGSSTALLAGDVLLVIAYDHLNRINTTHLRKIIQIFNRTAKEVCDGQQLDMEFEKMENVSMSDYLHMIELKTSVLLASCLQMGAILGGASVGNQQHLYEFGKNLGIAFQIQDDFLDAFGDAEKFGKEPGGDIKANKKTFLLIHALETGNASQQKKLKELIKSDHSSKVSEVLKIFRESKVDVWAEQLKEKYYVEAMKHLESAMVVSKRKEPLKELAQFLMEREY